MEWNEVSLIAKIQKQQGLIIKWCVDGRFCGLVSLDKKY